MRFNVATGHMAEGPSLALLRGRAYPLYQDRTRNK